jgi:hypothetical protein
MIWVKYDYTLSIDLSPPEYINVLIDYSEVINRDYLHRDDSRDIIIILYKYIIWHTKSSRRLRSGETDASYWNLSNSDFGIWYERLVGQKPNVCHCHTHTHTHARTNIIKYNIHIAYLSVYLVEHRRPLTPSYAFSLYRNGDSDTVSVHNIKTL